ncbi:MAG: DNA polymerase III subunit delta' [Hyphomonadaceae bacterium]|nr:DNA polymerase III subunit delta' [Clostridia bacterium]
MKKYKGFLTVYGHGNVLNALQTAMKHDKISHAYIFEGNKGVGKSTVASGFAKMLTCTSEDQPPCGVCKACLMSAAGSHPDILTVRLGEEKSIKVEEIRTITKEVYLKPYGAKRKVVIIPDADKMTEQSQNALLKTLEEPPSYAVLILVTQNASALLSTILSRAVVVRFADLSERIIAHYLEDHFDTLTPAHRQLIATICGGSIGRAKELAQTLDGDDFRHEATAQLAAFYQNQVGSHADFAIYLKKQSDFIDSLLTFYTVLFRDMLYYKEGLKDKVINTDLLEKISSICEQLAGRSIIKAVEGLLVAQKRLAMHTSFEITVENLLLALNI